MDSAELLYGSVTLDSAEVSTCVLVHYSDDVRNEEHNGTVAGILLLILISASHY